ncbi:hypothetical protein TBR22_A33870 [Luteitalea sp. TBR-22]|uniref:hypothetical protein n=1 Tax=Luteitalea sp. TBR-22 TaxID=2802971 RepID=UPI001AF79FC0|nr:hypothetical protein [Luteitalea sp. TBR-22]BCS34158.1 hypothetical protein TBR22_A33870 [Luteitalea sp. TBR-22]
MRTIALTLCLSLAMAAAAVAQAPTPPAATNQPTVPAVPAALPMAGPTGMVFHAIKADKTADFEAVMTRLRDLLAVSDDAVRRQQGAGWRVLKQATPLGDGSVLYVSLLDPVVANAEYDVPRLLAEAAPAEAAQLYEQFRAAHVQPTVQASNLTVVLAPLPAASAPAPKP